MVGLLKDFTNSMVGLGRKRGFSVMNLQKLIRFCMSKNVFLILNLKKKE